MDPQEWTVVARNLPEHARNAIHTDAGAQAAGFPRALVAGVTTYAYLTHPVVAAWGLDWLQRGGGEVRFRSPVFEHDRVDCTPRVDGEAITVEALVSADRQPRVTFRTVRDAGPPPDLRDGEPLRDRHIRLEGEWGSDYGVRAGDDLDLYATEGLVHPAVWPALANHVVHTDVARGSWIHTRSVIRHHAIARPGGVAEVTARIVSRISSGAGERAILDVRIVVEGTVVATLEHEAIVALA